MRGSPPHPTKGLRPLESRKMDFFYSLALRIMQRVFCVIQPVIPIIIFKSRRTRQRNRARAKARLIKNNVPASDAICESNRHGIFREAECAVPIRLGQSAALPGSQIAIQICSRDYPGFYQRLFWLFWLFWFC